MARISSFLMAGLAVLISTIAWCDDGLLVSDDSATNKVIRVFADGKIVSVFPPASEATLSRWKGVSHVKISPNRQYIAYGQHNDIWLYDIANNTSSRLTRVGKPQTNKYAPVEAQINYWSWNSDKLIYKVWHGIEDDTGDGPVLWTRGAEYGRFVHDLKSGKRIPIEFPKWREVVAAWLENGDFLLGDGGRFVRYNPMTKTMTPISANFGLSDDQQVEIIRNGSQMVFWGNATSVGGQGRSLMMFDFKSGEASQMTPADQFANISGWPKYSPNGNRVAHWHRVGSGAAYMPLVQSIIDGKSYSQANVVSREKEPHKELVVDGKVIYTVGGTVNVDWIDDSTLIAMVRSAGHMSIAVIDADSGAVKATHEWGDSGSTHTRTK